MKLPERYESNVVYGESGGAYQLRAKMDKSNVAFVAPEVHWSINSLESLFGSREVRRNSIYCTLLCCCSFGSKLALRMVAIMLGKCPECGQLVSIFNTSCPACGTTRFYEDAVLRARECPACHGSGTSAGGATCPECSQGYQFLQMTMDRRMGNIVAEKWVSNAPYPAEIDLIDAIGRQDIEEIRRLLAAGADPNRRVGFGITAMSCAAEHDETGDILRMLVAAGGNINLPDDYGQTPLHSAVDSAIDAATQSEKEIDWSAVFVVLQLGGDMTIPDGAGRTPRDWVAQCSASARESFEKLLRGYGSADGASGPNRKQP